MKNKLFLIILSIFLIGVTNALCVDTVNTFLIYDDNPSNNTISVIEGELVNLSITTISHNGELWHERLEITGKSILYEEYSPGILTLAGYIYTKNYTLNTSNLDEGIHEIKFTASTKTDCSVEFSTLILNMISPAVPDTTPPTLEIIYPINNQIYNTSLTQLTFNVTDENLDYCTYKLNNGPAVLISNPSNGLNTITGISSVNGTNVWSVTCYDKESNSNTKNITFIVDLKDDGDDEDEDTTPPTLEIIYPINNQIYNTSLTQLTFNVTDENLDYCTYKLNDGPAVLISNPSNGLNTITGISSVNGTNVWSVTCYDKESNSNTKNITFIVDLKDDGDDEDEDTTPPTLEIIYPINNQIYNTSLTQLTFNVTDENLDYCTYKLNDGPAVLISNPINGLNTITGINSTNGTNLWSVTCYDKESNSNTKNVTFIVDLRDDEDEDKNEKKTKCSCNSFKESPFSDEELNNAKIQKVYEDQSTETIKLNFGKKQSLWQKIVNWFKNVFK